MDFVPVKFTSQPIGFLSSPTNKRGSSEGPWRETERRGGLLHVLSFPADRRRRLVAERVQIHLRDLCTNQSSARSLAPGLTDSPLRLRDDSLRAVRAQDLQAARTGCGIPHAIAVPVS